ncbi:MAG: DUF6732 family protein [Pseudomonadota bacterium]
MTRLALTAAALTTPVSNALAHGGHVAASGGHDHWLAVGATIVAVLIGVGLFVRQRAKR